MSDTELAQMGHNNPPNDEEMLREFLADKTSGLRSRFSEILDGVIRMPTVCDDEEAAGKFADMVKLITACSKSFETMRVGEKEPYLTLGRAVDGYFKKFTDDLAKARSQAMKPLETYMRLKEQRERDARAAEAKRQREESERLAREAAELAAANMPVAAEETLKEAVRGAESADKAELAATVKPAELARTRGSYGGLATLRTAWVGKFNGKPVDMARLWPFISDEAKEKALNAFVRAGNRQLDGATISEESTGQVK